MHKERARILRNHRFKLYRELKNAKKAMKIAGLENQETTGNDSQPKQKHKKHNPFKKSENMYIARQKELAVQREEKGKKRIEQQRNIEEAKARHKASKLLCTSKTRKGQPLMKDRIKHMLEKITRNNH